MGLVCRFLMCTAVCVSVALCALSGGGGFEHRGVHTLKTPKSHTSRLFYFMSLNRVCSSGSFCLIAHFTLSAKQKCNLNLVYL